ncbi:MAG: enolase C-terminal domain-like protein [Solirubrobacteraceae bacterium]
MSHPSVASLSARAYTIPTDRPEADGTLAWDSTTMVVVEARAAGEIGTGWTYAPAAAVRIIEDLLAPVVVGRRSPLAPTTAQEAMVRAVRNAGRGGLVGMAISAVDIALWDLGARILGVPLTRWFGAQREHVPVYGSGGFTSYDDATLISEVEGWRARGLDKVKIKIGESWGTRIARDLQRTRLVRELVGEDVEVFVDANGGYRRAQARHVGERLVDLGVRWFEEPVTSQDLAGLAELRSHLVELDIAAGEYGDDLHYFHLMAPAVDCLQVDVTRCGGYTEWRRIAAAAAAYGVEISGHCAPYLTLPVAAASPGCRHLEWFHDHVRIVRELVEGYTPPVAGRLHPSPAPGHGLSLRRSRADSYRVA